MSIKYQKSHEWVTIENGVATVGISEHAQETLGDIAFVDLPSKGSKTVQGEEIATLESMKAASPIFAPLSGEIVESNGSLADSPEKINESPLKNGWLFKIINFSEDELHNLMSEDEYKAFL